MILTLRHPNELQPENLNEMRVMKLLAVILSNSPWG